MNRLLLRLRSFLAASRDASVTPPPAVESTPDDTDATLLIYGIYFTMVAFLVAALYVAFAYIVPTMTSNGAVASCRGDRANECGEGKVCREGTCVAEPDAVDCAEGGACDGCTCVFPMTCGEDNICRAPAEVVTKCSESSAKFAQEMVDFQAKCVSNAGGVPLSGCPTSNVKDFLLSHEAFDALLKDFPSGLMFLFPSGAPPLDALDGEEAPRLEPWPDETTRRFYVEAVQKQAKEFRRAKHIVLVGRASRGNANKNFAFAQARVRFARQVLLDALASNHVERGELSKKFIEFALGSERPLQIEFFQLYPFPAITWSSQSRQDLSRALGKVQKNQGLKRNERLEMDGMINRSVAIFAIPPECSGGV
jgi:hypothetical protein